jgi:hypothetical protein
MKDEGVDNNNTSSGTSGTEIRDCLEAVVVVE